MANILLSFLQSNPVPSTPGCVVDEGDQTCPVDLPAGVACPNNTWVWGCAPNQKCGGVQVTNGSVYYCSPPDPSLCPKFGDNNIGPSDVTISNGYQRQFYQNGQPLPSTLCTYTDLSGFSTMTPAQSNSFFQHADTSSATYQQVAKDYCFGTTTIDCPQDAVSGGQMPVCARMSTTNDAGLNCRQWLDQFDENTQIEYWTSYCTQGQSGCTTCTNTSHDCDCVNPEPALLFNELNSAIGFVAGNKRCWWVPCESSNNAYYVPPSVKNAGCSASGNVICETVVNFINSYIANGGQVDVNEVDNYTGCGNNNPFSYFLFEYGWVFVLLIVIIVLAIIFYFFRKNGIF